MFAGRWTVTIALVAAGACRTAPSSPDPPKATSQRLRGVYTYMADAASFAECGSQRTYLVAIEAQHIVLERAFLAARAPLLAEITARVEVRAPDGAAPAREHLIVEAVHGASPGEACTGPPLRGTTWVLSELDGRAVAFAGGQRAPEFTLAVEGSGITGFAGCNRMGGDVEYTPTGVRYAGVITTRLACPYLELESSFLSALSAQVAQRVVRERLELLDAGGVVRMRFEGRR